MHRLVKKTRAAQPDGGMASGLRRRKELSYFFGGHVFQVLAHHDAPEFGFDEALSPFPFGRPGERLTECRATGRLRPEFTGTPNAPGLGSQRQLLGVCVLSRWQRGTEKSCSVSRAPAGVRSRADRGGTEGLAGAPLAQVLQSTRLSGQDARTTGVPSARHRALQSLPRTRLSAEPARRPGCVQLPGPPSHTAPKSKYFPVTSKH